MLMKRLSVALTFSLLAATTVQAGDWIWEDEFRTFAAGEVREALPEELQSYAEEATGTLYGDWQYATAPADLTVWIAKHCARMIERMGLTSTAGVSVDTCTSTHYYVNGRDPGRVLPGETWLLWSPENDPAVIQANFTAAAETAAATAALAEPLTRGEAQELLNKIAANLKVDDKVMKDLVIAEVARQIAELPAAATISDEMVKDALTAYLLEHGDELGVESLPADLTASFAAITGRQDGIDTRFNTIEGTYADRFDGIDTRFNTIESTQGSKTDLWVALVALLIASVAAWIVMFRLPSKKAVTTDVKTVADRIEVVAQIATAAKTAADTATAAAKVATDAVTAVEQTATAAHMTAMQAHTLATQNFDSIHGLMPQQFFPTQVELDALSVGGLINLVFEAERNQRTLTITRDDKGLKIEGLAGRARVSVTDHKSLISTVCRAFAKAKTEKGSAVHAFAALKAVKAPIAA